MAFQIEHKIREVRELHDLAIDAELGGLLSLGIAKDRISLEHGPGVRTVVKVDGSPVSAFHLGYMENHLTDEHFLTLKKTRYNAP